MNRIISLMLFAVLAVMPFTSGAALLDSSAGAEKSSFKSYQEWKADKISTAKKQSANSVDVDSQAKWILEAARELSIKDYLALYVVQQPQKERFQLAAQKMKSAEIAELIEAYADLIKNSELNRSAESLNSN